MNTRDDYDECANSYGCKGSCECTNIPIAQTIRNKLVTTRGSNSWNGRDPFDQSAIPNSNGPERILIATLKRPIAINMPS